MSRTASSEREPYKPDNRAAIAAIERRRGELDVSIETLAVRAGMTERRLRRIRKSGRAWRREVNALRMALRSIEADRKSETELFGGTDARAGEGGAGRAEGN